MAEPVLRRFPITVQFNPNNIGTTVTPITVILPETDPPSPPKSLNIHQGISMLVFEVVTINQGDGPEAQFPTYPIEWFTNNPGDPFNTPIAQPDCFEVHWYNPRQCTIIATNSAIFQNEHPFNVVVAYENQTYGTDPVIVNLPPDG